MFTEILKKAYARGGYLCIYKNLLLYCKENQVDIDFLEQIVSMQVPEVVAGRPDNVKCYKLASDRLPAGKGSCHAGTSDQEGQPLESDEECSGAVEKGLGYSAEIGKRK